MQAVPKHDSYIVKPFKSTAAFEKWLSANYAKSEGLWVKIAKAASGIKTITYAQALEVALCYGWIDGLKRRVDEDYFVQKFTPRRKNSAWSAINKRKVAELIAGGRMQEGGMDAIAAAKKNGRWDVSA